jgi:DNA-binding NarL/FixJ family response regulator
MIRVAIIDDHQMIINGLESLFEVSNQEVAVVKFASTSAADFLEYLEKEGSGSIDIAVIDFQMPEINGVELIRKLTNDYPDVKCVLFSSYYSNYLIESAVGAGAVGCLPKNVGLNDLLAAIEEIHSKGYHVSDDFPEDVIRSLMLKSDLEPHFDFMAKITKREREIATLVAQGLSYKEIGAKLNISKRTVEGYKENFCKKTGVEKQAGITTYCIYMGWI